MQRDCDSGLISHLDFHPVSTMLQSFSSWQRESHRERREGKPSAGTETKTKAVKSSNTELSGLVIRNIDGTMKLRGWLAKQGRKGTSRAAMLHSTKTELAELVMDNL